MLEIIFQKQASMKACGYSDNFIIDGDPIALVFNFWLVEALI